ncbi:MAG TPA: bestrophin family ion channel [Flavisolibacter sp.]|jgi:putative membrane protein|nr:bestrophin family ion channel [Flavisolibacter sp.]
MISYNPKSWLQFIFNIHRTDTVRKMLPVLVGMAGYSWLVGYLELEYFRLSEKSELRNFSILHTLLGFAISMLLVFRTNTAYDRWWEGRRQWGALVNSSRNLAIKLAGMLDKDDSTRQLFAQLIPGFAFALKMHLQAEETAWILDEKKHPEIPNFDRNGHLPNQIAANMMARLQVLYRQQKITGDQLIFLQPEASSFLDVCGACERIKNTPIPYSYSEFIKKFIVLYVITLPIGLVFSLGYYVIPVVVFIFYVLGSLELIAEEIEDPFGKDSNDLPMQRMCENIQRNIEDILL